MRDRRNNHQMGGANFWGRIMPAIPVICSQLGDTIYLFPERPAKHAGH